MPSVDSLKQDIDRIVQLAGDPLLQLSGGEPTLRDDLPELVRYAKEAGCSYTQVNTNGIRLAEDESYVAALANAGLDIVFLQFDGVSDEIYRALRGRDLLETKLRAIRNCDKYRIGVTLVPTVVPEVNDHVLGDVIRLAVELFPAVRSVHFQPVTYLGRYPGIQSTANHYTLDELMHDSSDESLAAVEAYLKQVKDLVAGWEADFGKDQMTRERGYVSLNWSGDAVWAIEEAAEVGVNLKYVVPQEGSNVWFDGWVIPKYAVNVKAATYFIDFMCRPDIAIRNMDATGYVSANGDISVLESQIDEELDPIDVSYFFPGADSVRVDPVLYPDKATIELCALEHDWGEDTAKLIEMWSRVKGENANVGTIIVVVLALLALAALGIWSKAKKARRGSSRKRR